MQILSGNHVITTNNSSSSYIPRNHPGGVFTLRILRTLHFNKTVLRHTKYQKRSKTVGESCKWSRDGKMVQLVISIRGTVENTADRRMGRGGLTWPRTQILLEFKRVDGEKLRIQINIWVPSTFAIQGGNTGVGQASWASTASRSRQLWNWTRIFGGSTNYHATCWLTFLHLCVRLV